jgi:FSR family fosmidomycin resistance protein-like MFS transporter
MRRSTASPWQGVAALALNHGANDMYMAFLPALLPLIAARLDLSYSSAGLLVSIVTLTSQLSQPLFGFLGDRVGRRTLAIAAPVATALSMSWLGLLNSYELLLVVLILGGVGTAAFHPQGAALTSAVARRNTGVAMAVFTAGGNLGYGAGSVLITVLVSQLGLGRTWIMLPIGLAAAAVLIAAVPRSVESRREASSHPAGPTPNHWLVPLIILYLVVMLRGATVTTFTTFVPILIERRGLTLVLGGWALFGFSLAGAVGGVVGGRLSERIGRKAVTVVGLGLAAPLLYLFLRTDGFAAAALLLLTGICVFSALPTNILMAQELLPRHASMVSGVVMGFAWGVGGLATTGLGALADISARSLGGLGGLERAMDLIALMPLAAAFLALALPETRHAGSQRLSPPSGPS